MQLVDLKSMLHKSFLTANSKISAEDSGELLNGESVTQPKAKSPNLLLKSSSDCGSVAYTCDDIEDSNPELADTLEFIYAEQEKFNSLLFGDGLPNSSSDPSQIYFNNYLLFYLEWLENSYKI